MDCLIVTVRLAPGTREDKLRLLLDQFDDESDAEKCELCVGAIIGACYPHEMLFCDPFAHPADAKYCAPCADAAEGMDQP